MAIRMAIRLIIFLSQKKKCFERHSFLIALRIHLPSPTANIYAQVNVPNILYHLEKLPHPLPHLLNNPLPLLISIYLLSLPTDHTDLPQTTYFSTPHTQIISSDTQQS